MYRVMIADDEGIVIDSLRVIIERSFPEDCVVESAKTGRSVIELAERFRPDIAFMDIQMPGINGIDAIEEIQKTNPTTQFIILSAYDKFDYAKKALSLGVMEYMMKPFEAGKSNRIISEAKAYIESNFHRDITLEEVSRTINISPYYFSRMFKEETNVTFIEYVTEERIKRAKQLLEDRQLSIKEVCLESGYGDPNYFSRIFKKAEGVTPTEYRERLWG